MTLGASDSQSLENKAVSYVTMFGDDGNYGSVFLASKIVNSVPTFISLVCNLCVKQKQRLA